MIVQSEFAPARWLRNPHAQTVWASTVRRIHLPTLQNERLELPDGDFVDLFHLAGTSQFRVCLFHGLEGTLESNYLKGLLNALKRLGICATLMMFRGCSGEPNRFLRTYHSGHTQDIRYLISVLQSRNPQTPLAAVGYSLGGNALLKYQGEEQAASPLSIAIAVSPPFMLAGGARQLNRGISKIYQRHLIKLMKKKMLIRLPVHTNAPFAPKDVIGVQTLYEFDDKITAPLHGFDGADHYYTECSSKKYLHKIASPTHIVYSRDDPFFECESIPREQDLSSYVTLELSDHGGHVGFVAQSPTGMPNYWLEQRLPEIIGAKMSA
ncbi:MAG: hydrolase [Pseudomonadota bacterium]